MTQAKSGATIARRLASQTWGEVQVQNKLADGIWLFHTAGHGGYVVDTNIHPELREFNEIVETRTNSGKYYPHEQHFAPFEEDCEYAKVEWLYPFIMKKLIKLYTVPLGMTFEQWRSHRLENVKKSLLNWNPSFLAKYPNHGRIT